MSSLCLFFPSAISVIGFPLSDLEDTLETKITEQRDGEARGAGGERERERERQRQRQRQREGDKATAAGGAEGEQ
jgi:hypothetical protein